jgi:hypothetical protein
MRHVSPTWGFPEAVAFDFEQYTPYFCATLLGAQEIDGRAVQHVCVREQPV